MIEFVVDEKALVDRIVKRADETKARGQPVRKDDNPEVFKTRLEAYKAQTAPLLGLLLCARAPLKTRRRHGPIDEVTEAMEGAARGG